MINIRKKFGNLLARPDQWNKIMREVHGHQGPGGKSGGRAVKAVGLASGVVALFGRRPPERVDGLLIPASVNLHMSRHCRDERRQSRSGRLWEAFSCSMQSRAGR